MGTGRTDEFRKDAVRIALTSGLSRQHRWTGCWRPLRHRHTVARHRRRRKRKRPLAAASASFSYRRSTRILGLSGRLLSGGGEPGVILQRSLHPLSGTGL